MIVARGIPEKGEDTIVVLGITEENVRRLKNNDAIRCTHDIHKLPKGLQIIIMYGKTEEEIKRVIRLSNPECVEINERNRRDDLLWE
jgi:hypothetical protein